jgi:tetratricopeptide (TPR) repeat protein
VTQIIKRIVNSPLSNSIILSLLLVSTGIVAQIPTRSNLTAAQWQSDVRYLGEQLPLRHRNAFHRAKREDFEALVKSVYEGVPNMTEDEILTGILKIVAFVKDGHTNVYREDYVRSGLFPLRMYLFSDGLYITRAAPAYGALAGSRVLRIGNMSTEEALKAAKPAVSADNDQGFKDRVPRMFMVPEFLAGLKISDSKQKLRLTVEKDGKEQTVTIEPSAPLAAMRHTPAEWVDSGPVAKPLYLRDPDNIYWFEHLKEQRIFYVQHNAIANKPDEAVADFYKRVFEMVDANPVDKFILDLRNNGGGNNYLNAAVVVQLIKSKINKRGKLFVISGRTTFSAAQNLLNQIEKYTEAIIVGEPTGEHPNMYGDAAPFKLPNSGITVEASTVWWQDLDPRDEREWDAPEIAADISFADYRAGRDPSFQAVLDYVPGSTLSELIANAGSQNSLGDFVARYRAIKADPRSRYVNSETAMNVFGYDLLEKKRPADAIEVFKLNAEAYPLSANVYDSLGDGFAAAGHKEAAIKSYEKALRIDPTFASSLNSLRRLTGN